MALLWSTKRKLLYSSTIGGGLLLAVLVLYGLFFIQAPTCFDGKENGNETGIDCGGSCVLLCKEQLHAPKLKWVRAFPISTSTYAVAAYIENTNIGVGAHGVRYSFQLFDDQNQLVIEKEGITDIPPIRTFPIIEPFINIGHRTVARAYFAFSQDVQDVAWKKVFAESVPVLSLSNQQYSTDTQGTRLSVMLHNDTVQDAKNITVAAILFDADGVARAASESLIALVPHRSTQAVVFTWPGQIQGVASEEITIIPSF